MKFVTGDPNLTVSRLAEIAADLELCDEIEDNVTVP